MSEPAPAAPSAPVPRPWWVPLLGVGSLGLGGMQGLGGLMLLWAASLLGGGSAKVFLGLGLVWLVPGVLLAVSGVGVVMGTRWARGLSLASVAVGCLAFGLVAWNRDAIPAAVADFIEYGEREHGSSKDMAGLYKRLRESGGGDPSAVLRDPEMSKASAWTFTAECCCPVVPWYLIVLIACGFPSGRRIARSS
jgi:hypothetical protein